MLRWVLSAVHRCPTTLTQLRPFVTRYTSPSNKRISLRGGRVLFQEALRSSELSLKVMGSVCPVRGARRKAKGKKDKGAEEQTLDSKDQEAMITMFKNSGMFEAKDLEDMKRYFKGNGKLHGGSSELEKSLLEDVGIDAAQLEKSLLDVSMDKAAGDSEFGDVDDETEEAGNVSEEEIDRYDHVFEEQPYEKVASEFSNKYMHPNDWIVQDYGTLRFDHPDLNPLKLRKNQHPGFNHTPDAVKNKLYQLWSKDHEYWTPERLSRRFGIQKIRVMACIMLKDNEKKYHQGRITEDHIDFSEQVDEEFEDLVIEAGEMFGRDFTRPYWDVDDINLLKPEAGEEHLIKSVEVTYEELEAELKKRKIVLTPEEWADINAKVTEAKIQGFEPLFEFEKRPENGKDVPPNNFQPISKDALLTYLEETHELEPEDTNEMHALEQSIKILNEDGFEIEVEVDDDIDGSEIMLKNIVDPRDWSEYTKFRLIHDEEYLPRYKKAPKEKAPEPEKIYGELKQIPRVANPKSKFAFKEISKNAKDTSPTVILDKDGILRYASEEEEFARSWVQKRSELVSEAESYFNRQMFKPAPYWRGIVKGRRFRPVKELQVSPDSDEEDSEQ